MFEKFKKRKNNNDKELLPGVPASYRELEPASPYRGNPFVEALPAITEDDIFEAVDCRPKISPQMRKLPADQRRQLLVRLKHFLFPLEDQHVMGTNLVEMIIEGYLDRNPMQLRRNLRVKANSQNRQERNKKNPVLIQTTSDTILLTGVSGSGKTTLVKKVLHTLFDQLIVHTYYNNRPFSYKQIVYLLVECPYSNNSPVEELCYNILAAFDKALGTDLYVREALEDKLSPVKMINKIGDLMDQHAVGVIAIDEVQHLIKNGRVSMELVNMLTTVLNCWNVPICFVGTPEATKLLDIKLRTSRRISTKPEQVFDRIPKDSEDWSLLMDALFELQLTKTETKLTPELSDAMYDCTQGILALVITLFRRVQYNLISDDDNDKEIITKKAIFDTYKKDFKSVSKIIEAMKNNDLRYLIHLEDAINYLDREIDENAFTETASEELKLHMKLQQMRRDNLTGELYAGLVQNQELFESLTEKRLNEIAKEGARRVSAGEDRSDVLFDLIAQCRAEDKEIQAAAERPAPSGGKSKLPKEDDGPVLVEEEDLGGLDEF